MHTNLAILCLDEIYEFLYLATSAKCKRHKQEQLVIH